MNSKNIFQKTNFNGQKEFKKDPEERQGENLTINEQKVQIILIPVEVVNQKQTGHYPRERIVIKEVNGNAIEETQKLFRYDPLGTLIRNDDIKGQSWRYQEPIDSADSNVHWLERKAKVHQVEKMSLMIAELETLIAEEHDEITLN